MEEPIQSLWVDANPMPSWHLKPDRVLDFGKTAPIAGASLVGALTVGRERFAAFHLSVKAALATVGAIEPFVFSANGSIIGRIAIEIRRLGTGQIAAEELGAQRRGRRQAIETARSLGHRIGDTVVSLLNR